MKATIAVALVLGLVFAGVHGQAEAGTRYRDGSALAKDAQEFEQAEANAAKVGWYSAGMYVGYVLGVADVYFDTSWCPNDGVPVRHTANIVSKYLKKHPEYWHKAADVLVLAALQQAFPCK